MRARSPVTAAGVLVPLVLSGGCVERRISVTSEPPGATVWINDTEIGRTPVDTEFLHYGDFDVRVRLDGYEPIRETRGVTPPVYDFPPLDLFASALPARFENVVRWHFVLERPPETSGDREAAERDLIERASLLRSESEGPPAPR